MILAGAMLFLAAFVVSLIGVALARRYALKLGLMDAPGERKVHAVATPRNGGIGIFWGFALPLIVGIAAAYLMAPESFPPQVVEVAKTHWAGVRYHVPLAVLFLACALGIHLLGLMDD